MPVTHTRQVYRPDIDGLRAAAVLAVVFYHAGLPGFTGGFVGVDVFFVISGYLITGIIWSGLADRSFSLQHFYVRRIKRIFPALFAMLLLSSIAAFILLIPADLAAFGKSADATVLFLSNFHWIELANYFDGPAIEKPLLHTWSLAVEEQFYAVWPLILFLLVRTVSAKKIPYAIAGLALVSLVLAEARMPDYQKDAFYLPWCRAWELFLGAALAVSPVCLRQGRLATALAGAGFAGIVLAVVLYDPSTRFPGLTALLPCGGAALLIAAGNSANPVSRLLSLGPVRWVGLISYSLYLIHWPLFSFAHLYLSEELTLTIRLIIVAMSFLLAHLSWRYIETPFRRANPPSLRVFATAAAAMGCLALAGASFALSGGFPFRVNEEVLQAQSLRWDYTKYCRKLEISLAQGATACAFGEDWGGAYDFVVWGDSHARHFAPAIASLARTRNMRGVLMWLPACHPFLDDSHTSKGCRNFNAAMARWIGSHPVKLAILGGRWITRRKYLKRYLAQESPAENTGGLAKTLAFLNGKGIAVSVLDQVPDFPEEISLCRARAIYYKRDFRACATQPAASFYSRHRVLDDYFSFLKKQYRFSLASATGAICDDSQCRASDGESLLMIDSHHLTEAGALRAMPYLEIPLLSGPGTESAPAGYQNVARNSL